MSEPAEPEFPENVETAGRALAGILFGITLLDALMVVGVLDESDGRQILDLTQRRLKQLAEENPNEQALRSATLDVSEMSAALFPPKHIDASGQSHARR